MRYAILGDIHGNYDALTAVLEALRGEQIDRYVCVGDIVGYAAEPERCIARLRDLDAIIVAGNHDHAVLGKTSIEYFNEDAREAVLWTRDRLSEEDKHYLDGLELVAHESDFMVVHSTPVAPESFDYIQTMNDAVAAFGAMVRRICFVGHSHVPVRLHSREEKLVIFDDATATLEEGERVIVNVGSVGQPRDHNPKAAFAIFDAERNLIELRRTEYDVKAAAQKIIRAGLPESCALRLEFGI